MMRIIMPIILTGVAGLVFFMLTNPIYNDMSALSLDVGSYNEALDNSKALENERDKLTLKYNTINPDNLIKLKKLLPDNVDNIRLILEIEKIALPYGMVLKDVKYSAAVSNTEKTTATKGAVIQGGVAPKTPKDYGIFNLEFSVSGTYDNFISFIKDLESNLRIVDISSITFSSSGTDTGGNNNNSKTNLSEIYKYDFAIKTYWLKN